MLKSTAACYVGVASNIFDAEGLKQFPIDFEVRTKNVLFFFSFSNVQLNPTVQK